MRGDLERGRQANGRVSLAVAGEDRGHPGAAVAVPVRNAPLERVQQPLLRAVRHRLAGARDLVDPDVGLSFPAGFLDAAPEPREPVTTREQQLLGLAKAAALDRRDEIELTRRSSRRGRSPRRCPASHAARGVIAPSSTRNDTNHRPPFRDTVAERSSPPSERDQRNRIHHSFGSCARPHFRPSRSTRICWASGNGNDGDQRDFERHRTLNVP